MTDRGRFRRFERLRTVVDFMLDHPPCLMPPWCSPKDTHYPNGLVHSQRVMRLHTGVLEARIVHEQDSAYDPRDEYAAVRRVIWDIEGDWNRCRAKNVVRPRIVSECFRVSRQGLMDINRAVKVLGKNAGPFTPQELILDQHPDLKISGIPRRRTRPAQARRVTFGTYGPRVDLRFIDKWVEPPFNRSWDRVWRVLGSSMTSKNSFGPGRFTSHGITPNELASALANEDRT